MRKLIPSLTCLAIALSLVSVAHAQNVQTDTLKWTSDLTEELNSNTSIAAFTTITTCGTYVRFQRDNDTFQFDVSAVEGDWADLSASGKMVFKVSYQTQPGLVKVERTQSQLYIEIDFTASFSGAMHQKIIVSNYQVVNN